MKQNGWQSLCTWEVGVRHNHDLSTSNLLPALCFQQGARLRVDRVPPFLGRLGVTYVKTNESTLRNIGNVASESAKETRCPVHGLTSFSGWKSSPGSK